MAAAVAQQDLIFRPPLAAGERAEEGDGTPIPR
jgi:hypothetical protein